MNAFCGAVMFVSCKLAHYMAAFWLTDRDLGTKFWGSVDKLRLTVDFVAVTGQFKGSFSLSRPCEPVWPSGKVLGW